MKKLVLGAGIIVGCFAFAQKTAAQVRVGVNINIGDQPSWRDPGYDYVQYYYLPDVESYYYVPTRQFIYLSNGRWVFSASLPARFRSYNLHTGYKVVVNRPNAYNYFEQDRRQYRRNTNWNNGYRHNNGSQRHDNGRQRGGNKHRRH